MAEGALLRVGALLQLLEIAGGGFGRILPLGQVVAEKAVGEELPVQAAELLKEGGLYRRMAELQRASAQWRLGGDSSGQTELRETP